MHFDPPIEMHNMPHRKLTNIFHELLTKKEVFFEIKSPIVNLKIEIVYFNIKF